MALVQETGTGADTSANTFATVAEAIAYWAARNDTSWAALSTAAQEAALLRAMDYLETRPRFRGQKVRADQPLTWPRSGAVDDDGNSLTLVPAKVKTAQIELAYRNGVGATDLSPDIPAGGQKKREKVDVIEVEYFDGAEAAPAFPLVTRMLRALTVDSSALLRS